MYSTKYTAAEILWENENQSGKKIESRNTNENVFEVAYTAANNTINCDEWLQNGCRIRGEGTNNIDARFGTYTSTIFLQVNRRFYSNMFFFFLNIYGAKNKRWENVWGERGWIWKIWRISVNCSFSSSFCNHSFSATVCPAVTTKTTTIQEIYMYFLGQNSQLHEHSEIVIISLAMNTIEFSPEVCCWKAYHAQSHAHTRCMHARTSTKHTHTHRTQGREWKIQILKFKHITQQSYVFEGCLFHF